MRTNYVPKTGFSEIAHPLARGRSPVRLAEQARGSNVGGARGGGRDALAAHNDGDGCAALGGSSRSAQVTSAGGKVGVAGLLEMAAPYRHFVRTHKHKHKRPK